MKRALKHEIFEKRKALSKEDVKEKSRKIKENLFSLEEFKKAKNIMFYVSFKNEVGTHEMLKELIAKKEKTIIVPYVLENYPILQKLLGFLSPGNYTLENLITKKLIW